jgi:hypothetical protein
VFSLPDQDVGSQNHSSLPSRARPSKREFGTGQRQKRAVGSLARLFTPYVTLTWLLIGAAKASTLFYWRSRQDHMK